MDLAHVLRDSRPLASPDVQASVSAYLLDVGPEAFYLSGSRRSDPPQTALLLPPALLLTKPPLSVMAHDRPDELANERKPKSLCLLCHGTKKDGSYPSSEHDYTMQRCRVRKGPLWGWFGDGPLTAPDSLTPRRLLPTFLAAATFHRLSWAKSVAIHCISSSK